MRTERLYLKDIVEACDAIAKFIAGLDKEEVINDDLILSAILRKLEIIGEASSRVSPQLQDEHPEIEWAKIKGFRNIVAHQYFSCDLDLTWEVAANRVPELRGLVQPILSSLEKAELPKS